MSEKSLHGSLAEPLHPDKYTTLAEAALFSIILFNRRRSGEVQRMKVSEYLKGENAGLSVSNDVTNDLGVIEKLILKSLTRIEIMGILLLCKTHNEALKVLMRNRGSVGDATAVIRKISATAHIEEPERMRSTPFRKHIATMSQLVDLSKVELD